MRLPDPPLLVITDRRQARQPLEAVAEAAFAGGCRWLSLREKDLSPAERSDLLRRLVGIGQSWDATVGIHEDLDAAQAVGAGSVHLPDGASADAARTRLGAAVLIGVSAHDGSGVSRASAQGADYATLSPFFLSRSKPGYGPALGPDGFARMIADADLPVLALGGIDRMTVSSAIAAGAAGVAVMGGVMAADDPAAAVAELIATLGTALAARRSPGNRGVRSS